MQRLRDAARARAREELRQAGFSILELAVYAAVAAVLGSPLVYIAQASVQSTKEHDMMNRVAERSRVAMHRIARDFRPCIADTVAVLDSGKTLRFTQPDSYDGTAIVPGDVIEYRMALVDDESQNGRDDNGNGLVDEGLVVRANLTTEASTEICRGINLTSSSFAQNGNGVTISVVSAGQLTRSDAEYSLSYSLNVFPRN